MNNWTEEDLAKALTQFCRSMPYGLLGNDAAKEFLASFLLVDVEVIDRAAQNGKVRLKQRKTEAEEENYVRHLERQLEDQKLFRAWKSRILAQKANEIERLNRALQRSSKKIQRYKKKIRELESVGSSVKEKNDAVYR